MVCYKASLENWCSKTSTAKKTELYLLTCTFNEVIKASLFKAFFDLYFAYISNAFFSSAFFFIFCLTNNMLKIEIPEVVVELDVKSRQRFYELHVKELNCLYIF